MFYAKNIKKNIQKQQNIQIWRNTLAVLLVIGTNRLNFELLTNI